MTHDIDDAAIALPPRRANRPITISHRIEAALAYGLIAFFRVIGIDAASFIAGKFLRILGPMLPSVARRAHDNLQRIFPDWTDAQIQQTTKGVFENLGRTAAEFAHLKAFTVNGANGRLFVHGFEHAQAALARGRPVIFFSAHLANWEIMAIALKQLGIKNAVVYRAANNPLVDGMIIQLRANVMSRLQIPKGPLGARQVIEAVKDGYSLAMLVDQKMNDGIQLDFFGHPAMTAPAPARIAQKYGLTIMPGAIVRRKGARFDLYFRPPVFVAEPEQSPDAKTTEAITQKLNDALEKEIRAHPEQWLWLHRRWPKSN